MSDLVAKARAALDGVTPGPWDVDLHGCDNVMGDVWQGEDFRICENGFAEDARFIAAARSLVPEMADRIEALEAEVARLREAERTAWERGRDAAADAALEWARTYHMVSPDAIIRAITPEARHD